MFAASRALFARCAARSLHGPDAVLSGRISAAQAHVCYRSAAAAARQGRRSRCRTGTPARPAAMLSEDDTEPSALVCAGNNVLRQVGITLQLLQSAASHPAPLEVLPPPHVALSLQPRCTSCFAAGAASAGRHAGQRRAHRDSLGHVCGDAGGSRRRPCSAADWPRLAGALQSANSVSHLSTLSMCW